MRRDYPEETALVSGRARRAGLRPTGSRPPRGPATTTRARAGLLRGLLVTLVVAVPSMVVAEEWHGRPMIDQPGLWWLLPGAVAVAGFFAGGALAARPTSSGERPTSSGRACATSAFAGARVGALAAVLLVAADGARRALLDPTLPAGVVAYWVEAAAAAVVASVSGAVVAELSRRRRSLRSAP
ncbi:MAG: hypothetical protein M0T80_10555 [Actinomycetota bacterium]|nr:hypothetical protein [Actinomycetota bacterium]